MKKQVRKKVIAILLVVLMVMINCLTIFAQDTQNEIATTTEETQKLLEEAENSEYIDISAKIVANFTYNGQEYTKELLLTKSDFTSTNVFLAATQSEQNVTFVMDLNNISEDKDSLEAGHIRVGGTYPTGTSDNPVNYVLTLKKDVTITDENGIEITTIPTTFTAKFNYWTEDVRCFEFSVEEPKEIPNEDTLGEDNIEELQAEPADENETGQTNVEENDEEKEVTPQNIDEPVVIEPITWSTEEIKAVMILTGRNLKAEEFTFEFVNGDGTVVAEGKNTAAKKGEAAEIVFAGKEINYDKAGEYTYTIREANNKLGGVTYDTTSYEITLKVSEIDGKLSTEVVYPENGITFNNVYDTEEADIVLTGTTYLDAGGRKLKAEEFSFNFIETDENGKALENASAQKVMNNAEGKFSVKFTYALKNVGTHYYKVTEVAGKETGMTYADNSYLVKVEVKDNGDGTLSVLSENNTKLDFTNKYEADGSIAIKAETKLKGRTLKIDEFKYKLEAVTKGAPMPKKVIAANAKDGTVAFSKIAYDEDDIGKTYEYRIFAIKGNLEKMTYDQRTQTVKVTITDKGNAKLEIKQSTVPTFYHEYDKIITPKTGDNTMIPIYGIVAAVCGMVIVLGLRKIKREKRA